MTQAPTISRLGAFSLLCVATLTIMVGSVIVPGLPSIARALDVDEPSWLVTLPSLGVVIFGPLAGRLIDRIGARPSILIGLVLYGLLGVIGAVGMPPLLTFADRFLLGGATALLMAGGAALISDFFHGEARLEMMAWRGMAIELGGVFFLALGGTLAALGWRWPFALYLMAWIFLVMVLRFVPRPQSLGPAPDHGQVDGGLIEISDIYLAAGGSMTLFFSAILTLPQHLAVLDLSEAMTGYYLAFISLVAVTGAGIMPRVRASLGQRRTFLLAFSSYVLAYTVYSLSSHTAALAGAALLLGTGFGFSVPMASHEVVERSVPARRGRNLAALSVSIFLGQFLSSLVAMAMPGPRATFGLAAALAAILGGVFVVVSRRVAARRAASRQP
ncbi:MFS transporter [Pseudenhygromyxa sp. WMMC2535]|uniref:MFS transporter n=1 Tax=Pseudenhygromyxa sp. WMMC2535 TaxID=2712867 RepID=UPI0015539449|nr:MFS transporter [Pseudenhygromyxa sp. WMMC2535]NVB42930.1 MFS transporter [Pseudenhygromyxa sp. WMMC2535]